MGKVIARALARNNPKKMNRYSDAFARKPKNPRITRKSFWFLRSFHSLKNDGICRHCEIRHCRIEAIQESTNQNVFFNQNLKFLW